MRNKNISLKPAASKRIRHFYACSRLILALLISIPVWWSIPAYGATPVITVSVNGDGGVAPTITSTFEVCTSCDANGQNCVTNDSGSVYLEESTSRICGASGHGSASCSAILDRKGFQGTHVFTGIATDCKGTKITTYALTLDNTPSVNVTSPGGTITGLFDIAGTATFKPTLYPVKGWLDAYIDNSFSLASKTCTTEDCSISYKEITGTLYDMGSNGPHTVMLIARSAGGIVVIDKQTFTIDKTPSVSVTSPTGMISGPFDIAGTATFNPTLKPIKGWLDAYIDNSFSLASKACATEDCSISYKEATGKLYDMCSNGPHTLILIARNSFGTTTIDKRTFIVDKTPAVAVTEPSGLIASPFDIAGTAVFKPTNNDIKGKIDVFIDDYLIGSKNCTTEECSFSYKEYTGGKLYTLRSVGLHTVKLTASACGHYVSDQKNFTIKCDLVRINEFSGTSTAIDPTSGGNINFSGSLTNNSGQSIIWTLTVAGRKIGEGNGLSVSAIWDGKDASGKEIEAGTYTATLEVKTADGKCTDSKDIRFTVKENPDDCMLKVDFGSSANVASGNLNHSQTLFSIPDSKLLSDFVLTYNSLDGYSGSLGTGWTHTYNINMVENNDSSYTVRDGNGSRITLYQNGNVYTPELSAYPVMTKNQVGTVQLTYKDGTEYTFSASGKMLSMADRNANTMLLSYDMSNNLTSIADQSGRLITLSYDAANRITIITDPNGNRHSFTYTNNNLIEVTTVAVDNSNQSWKYTYDSNGYMLMKTDPQSFTTTYTYDSDHRAKTATDPEGRVRSIVYQSGSDAIKTTTVTEKDGGVWTYKYDTTMGVLTEKIDPRGGKTTYQHDQKKNLISKIDPDGSVTAYTYDANGNMISVKDAASNTTTYTYSELNKVTSITDSQGRVTQYTYDDRGNLTSITDPSGATTLYQYDARGNITAVTNPDNKITAFAYDQSNNLISITDAAGATTAFTYDSVGNMTSQTDASGNTTLFEYDSLNRLIKVTDPNGNATQYAYDAKGNRTSIIDANGNITFYEYNYRGQITKIKDALGNITTYTYGSTGCPSCGGGVDKLTTITDANGNTTRYEYDMLGRLTKETDPKGNAINYVYDASGNLISKTDASGVTITYTYDALKRLTSLQFPDSSQKISYTYDTTGKVLTMKDQSGTTSYTYDNANRLLSETRQINGISYTTSYAYTQTGSLSSITYPSGRTVTYNKDAAGRLTSVTGSKDGVTKNVITNIAYNPNGTISALTHANGIVTSKTYDTRGALSSLAIGNLKQLSYSRDNVGNITAINDLLDPSKTKTYAYDALYRLTQATLGTVPDLRTEQSGVVESGLSPYTISYTYDPIGNRTAETAGSGTTNYTYGAANQLISSTGAKPFAFSYDKNGNAVADNQRSYTYNQNQRLIKAVENNKTLGEYLYNGNGQRVKKTVDGKITYFIYDQSGNLIEEIDGDGKPVADYIYLGSTPIARVDMNRDILPPVTTATVGTPFYESGTILYISAVTTITLSVVDEGNPPAGVDYTEYRIDNETSWRRYSAPFTLNTNTDGMHTVYYRSVDKAGNIEDTKSSTVYLDATPSQSAINIGIPNYQAGDGVFINGITPITIAATDSASGVARIEYAIDGGDYIPYAGTFGLTLNAEGQHTIRYRSTDNVSNTEEEKTATVTLDTTPPVSVITASDPLIGGVANIVSPNTRFYINAADTLSGVNAVQYRIDNSSWTTYQYGFTLIGAGTHTIGFRAIDNIGNVEAEKAIEVKVIVIDVTREISLEPIVLAGAWKHEHEDEHGRSPETESLASILSGSGLSYYIPQTEHEFKESLRLGRYNTYLLMDYDKKELIEELKSAVHYGDGLVYIKTRPDDEHSISDIFGVKFNGMSTNKDLTINLAESEISYAGALQTNDKVVKSTITAQSAKILGFVNDKKTVYPVIVSNTYGRGRVVLFSFDLLNSPDHQKAKDLIVNSLNYVAPKEHYTHALSDAQINITLQNSTEPTDIWVTETVPVTTTVDGIIPAATLSGNVIPWQLSLGASEKIKLGYWLNLPDMAGDYLTNTSVNYNNLGNYRTYGNYTLNLNVALNSTDLLRSIVADIKNLIPQTKKDMEKIEKALEELDKINQNASRRKEAGKNIERILEAIEELSESSLDTSGIRLKLDELLKVWQKKWSLMPVEIERDEDDRDNDDGEHANGKHKKHSMLDSLILPYETVAKDKRPVLIASTGSISGLMNAPKSSDVVYFYHTDHLGTPIMMTDIHGMKVWEAEYMPFGEPVSITGTVDNNLRFPGQYYDKQTGNHYNYFRDYNPKIGRYLESDPIGLNGGVNLYSFVGNNSINAIDPLGLWQWYGNWGGPDWTGGREGTWNTIDRSRAKPPIDKQDACYRDHDVCYGGCRDNNSCKSKGRAGCFKDCDRKLAKCLRGLGNDPSNNWKAKAAAAYFENSSPGGN